MNRPVQSIVVVGDDAAAWLAAAALRRAFRHRNLAITVLEPGDTAEPVAGRWTLPALRGLHSLLGIPEAAVLHKAQATYKLGTAHVGWQGEGSEFVHAHGEIGEELAKIPFYKFLLNEALEGRPQRPEHFSIAATGALRGRFARPMAGNDALTSSFTYAFHLEESGYINCVRAAALQLGVARVSAELLEVLHEENGDLRALRLVNGATLAADYFLDCTGARGLLIGACDTEEREDWSHWLPCDRMWSGRAAAIANAPPLTICTAREHGWTWRSPLRQSSIAGYAYSSAFVGDDAALEQLRASTGAIDAPRLRRFASGRRRDFWVRNCVALGSAALQLEPLVGADLHGVHLGVATFIELFPLDKHIDVEAREYNRIMGEHADALRDFTIAHYRLGAPRAGAFWSATRAAPEPERLAHKLELYRANGRIALRDQESFEETDWAWLALGSGDLPASLDAQAQMRVARVSAADVAPLRARIEQLVASMPPHLEYVERAAARVS